MSKEECTFKHGFCTVKEMIEQIELYLQSRQKDFHLTLNDIIVIFDKFKYTEFEYMEGKYFYEFSFLKNNETIGYFELYDDYKVECCLLCDILYEIKFLDKDMEKLMLELYKINNETNDEIDDKPNNENSHSSECSGVISPAPW